VYAVTIPQPGGPEALTWAEVDDPVPGPDEVLIDISASAVNRADLMQRAGLYPPPPGAPPYPGLECSGRVAALGANVTQWHLGDEVCALLGGGGYAEKVTVPAQHCLPVPAGVSVTDAAALPEVACTVWSNVFDLAGLRAGEVLLLHGGGSGIGTFAIQLAKARGARVLTTARAPKHQALRELGADLTIDYAGEAFVAAVRAATDDRGADVILQGQEDGWDVLDALKTDPATRDIPVVIHSVIDNRRRAEQLGADDVLVKPAPAQIIRTVLGRLVKPQAAGAREVRHEPA